MPRCRVVSDGMLIQTEKSFTLLSSRGLLWKTWLSVCETMPSFWKILGVLICLLSCKIGKERWDVGHKSMQASLPVPAVEEHIWISGRRLWMLQHAERRQQQDAKEYRQVCKCYKQTEMSAVVLIRLEEGVITCASANSDNFQQYVPSWLTSLRRQG